MNYNEREYELEKREYEMAKNISLLSTKRTEFSKERTKLANQRTYLAYMSFGFALAAITSLFKNIYLVYFGVFIILVSSFQFIIINNSVESEHGEFNKWVHYIPLIYIPVSLMVLYLQYRYKSKK